MTIADQLKMEGRLEGLAEGEAKGRQEGQARILLRQLSLKFVEVPQELESRVHAASAGELERWAERVLTAATLADVFSD